VKADIHLLFVSSVASDQRVLNTLLSQDGAGSQVRVTVAASAEAFFEAIYSEQRFQIVIVDERQTWAEWQSIATACTRNRPAALLVLLAGAVPQEDAPESPWDQHVAAIYPRSSAGLIALARLVSTMAAQGSGFSLRQEKPHAAAEADESDAEEREKLVYAVSHDLQDPLQLARRYAEILNEDYDDNLGESGSKVLGHLQFNLSRTQEMLDELLDFSRLQSARPVRELVDFNELLDEVVSLYQLTLDEIGAQITRQQSLPTLMVDRRQFHRVLQNLIGNAIKFRSERPLRITVRAQRVRNEWRIGIKDNGIGIKDDDLGRIFGMFERAGAIETSTGTGMGLAICKRIVQNHGGNIWARSSLDGGSVFIFSIPQTDDATSAG